MQESTRDIFKTRFGSKPEFIIRAPGRVNLIGEHTDYNDGFVLPMAINRAIWLALRPRTDNLVRLYSVDFNESATFDLMNLTNDKRGWVEYPKGVAWVMQSAGHRLNGWEGVIAGDVPVGAGLSSSAALEMAVARAFVEVSGLEWKPAEMAKLGQRAENDWIGINSGIMDQMISASGVSDHALLIDCRSLVTHAVPLPDEVDFVVLDTKTRRGVVDSAYNERRRQCEQAATYFGVQALRDVSPADLRSRPSDLNPTIYQRARHVVTENERTLATVAALEKGDNVAVGKLMNESHASLSDDYEVSSYELNVIVSLALKHGGCYGARMTGAGFGGCAIAMVRKQESASLASHVSKSYQEICGLEPAVYICQASDGAKLVG